MTDGISPIGWIGRGIFNLFNVPTQAIIGGFGGSTAGIKGYKGLIGSAGAVKEIPASTLALADLAKLGDKAGIGQIVRAHVSTLFQKLFGYGLAGINGSGLGAAYKGILTRLTSQNFTALGTAIGTVGLPGLALLGVGGVLAGIFLMGGIRTGINGYYKWSDTGKGYPVDLVDKPWVHGLHSMTGWGTALGIGLLCVPHAHMIGAATAIGCGLGMFGVSMLRQVMGGVHYLNVPEAAPRPFNTVFRWLNNGERFYK